MALDKSPSPLTSPLLVPEDVASLSFLSEEDKSKLKRGLTNTWAVVQDQPATTNEHRVAMATIKKYTKQMMKKMAKYAEKDEAEQMEQTQQLNGVDCPLQNPLEKAAVDVNFPGAGGIDEVRNDVIVVSSRATSRQVCMI